MVNKCKEWWYGLPACPCGCLAAGSVIVAVLAVRRTSSSCRKIVGAKLDGRQRSRRSVWWPNLYLIASFSSKEWHGTAPWRSEDDTDTGCQDEKAEQHERSNWAEMRENRRSASLWAKHLRMAPNGWY